MVMRIMMMMAVAKLAIIILQSFPNSNACSSKCLTVLHMRLHSNLPGHGPAERVYKAAWNLEVGLSLLDSLLSFAFLKRMSPTTHVAAFVRLIKGRIDYICRRLPRRPGLDKLRIRALRLRERECPRVGMRGFNCCCWCGRGDDHHHSS